MFEDIKLDILGKDYSLSIAYVSEAKSRELNKKYRKKDKSTNVLSFALKKNLGELVLCKTVIEREAKIFEKNFGQWSLFLVIHGMLHLKGMQHSSTMEKAENFFYKKYQTKHYEKYFDSYRRRLGDDEGLVGEFIKGEKNPKIIGVGESETRGLRHGYIVDSDLAVASIRNAVLSAENTSGIKIRRALVSIGGISLRGEISSGSVIISKADGEVTALDLSKALQECEENLNLNNKKVIQSFPLSFRLDGKEVFGRLEGMRGTKLEIRALFITYSMQDLEDLIGAVAEAGVETIEVVAAPIAISHIALSEKQKIAGVGLVNIGAETMSLTVFENSLPIFLHTFSIGSSDITNDIALGFKIPLSKAESLKLGNLEEDMSKKKLDEIIEARLSDIFELIENHLKKIKRSELLPAGIVFVGGGSNISGIEELSKAILKLPASRGETEVFGSAKTKLRDSAWFTVLGLISSSEGTGEYSKGSFIKLVNDLKNAIKSIIKQLMP